MRFRILIVILGLSFSANAGKDPYQKLKRIYDKDEQKCLIKAKRIAQRKPKAPSPHYFTALIYFDDYKGQKTARKKTSRMSRTLTATKYLYKSDTTAWAGPIPWQTEINTILDSAHQLSLNLMKVKDTSRAKLIARKYEKITRKKVIFPKAPKKKKNSLIKKGADKKNKYVQIPTAFRDNKYFGLASGKELIKSHDRNKEKALLKLINDERRKKKLTPLIWEEGLARAARYHAYDMATQGYFSHDSYDRLDTGLAPVGYTFKRIRKFYNNTFVNSENIAAGAATAYSTYRQWYTSKGHYKNMFRKGSRRVGLGVYFDPDSPFKYYWVFCTAY